MIPHKQLTELGASTEAIEKLIQYVDLIRQWNKAINLMAPSTIKDIWARHIVDSAQLWPVIRNLGGVSRIIDLGSGGGLPGLVLAMMGAEQVTLIESDTRKCVFMREVSRETGLANVTIINDRIEKVHGITAPFVTARALAPLERLMEWAAPLLETGGKMVFLKGQDVSSELAALPKDTRAGVLLLDSATQNGAKTIVI